MILDSDNLILSNRELGGFIKKACENGLQLKFRAKGMSMSPFICDGDILNIVPFSKMRSIEMGDIVAYINPRTSRLIVHRIVKKRKNQYLLKGDNIYSNDGYCEKKNIYGYIKKKIIIGKKNHNYRIFIRKIFLFLNYFKKNIAILSAYKMVTPVCRLTNKLLY